MKRPKVRGWMQWDAESLCFLDEANRREFYELITGEDQDGQRLPPRLSDPKEIRDLGELMEDPVRFRQFLETATVSLQDAMRGVVIAERKVDWRGSIAQLINMIRQIPAVDLVNAREEDLKLLENVQNLCASLIRQAAAMK